MAVESTQLAAILRSEPAPFETMMSHLISASNEQRSQAKSIFNLIKQTDPNSLVLKLSNILRSSPHHKARAMSAILLRKLLTRGASFIWLRLTESTQSGIKTTLLTCIQREESRSIIKKLCDTVSELASAILPDNKWPELLPFMFRCVTSDIPKLKESAFLILSLLAQYLRKMLVPHIKDLYSVFMQSLNKSPNPDVRISGVSSMFNFIQCLLNSSNGDRFQHLLPVMMKTLTQAVSHGPEAIAQKTLELLIEISGAEPRFLRRHLVIVVRFMLHIADSKSLEKGTRHLAIEFVITLTEARERARGMMRQFPQFIRRLFAILMKMLLDVVDEPFWHSAEIEHEDTGKMCNYSVGQDQECLDRLAVALGGSTIFPVALELLPPYLAAPEWQKHHVALIALAQIAKGCSKVMIKNLEQVVYMVLSCFQDPHPRVRCAAINATGQLSTDLGPYLQVQYHSRVLRALVTAMDDFQNPRVQAHAVSAVLNFSEKCTPEILSPFLDGIVGKLLVLLQNGKKMVQEGALMALASVAVSSQEHFQKYHDTVMPYLKTILISTDDKSDRVLRAKAMECICSVGMAVGRDKFGDNAKQVIEVLMSLQRSQMEADDPTTSYMLQAWARLCKCSGQDFLPYMSVIMPPLLQSAQLKPDVAIPSSDSDIEVDDSDADSLETITLRDKRIGIKTSVLEEKATVCNMLCCYANELKEGFYPWIDQVAPTLVPLLKFYFDKEVRRAAVSAMPELLRSAKLAVEQGIAHGRNEAYVKQLSGYIIPALVEALHKEPDTKICSSMFDALNKCVQVSGPLLDGGQVRSIVEEIKQVITASSSRKRERAERAKAEDFDAEESELLKEENEQEEEVFAQVGEILGTLIKTFKDAFLPFFDGLSSYLMPMWGKDKTAEERRIAICIFDDVAEQCRKAALKYYKTYLPFLLEACHDESPDVQKAAVYGLGVCAEYGGAVFKPIVGEALSRLSAVIKQPYGFRSEKGMAYDSAVSALGKICQFHRDSVNSTQFAPACLKCLLIKANLNEAKGVRGQLCSMVERSGTKLLGPNNQYLPKFVSVSTEAMGIYFQEEIIIEILVRLPVRSLVRFKCVSKSWKALISARFFKMKHLNLAKNNQNSHKLLVHQYHLGICKPTLYCSSLFDQRGVNKLDFPSNGEPVRSLKLRCCYDGLILINVILFKNPGKLFILWNPSTRESIVLPHPELPVKGPSCAWGMGYDSTIDDYKILKIDHRVCSEILSLKSGSWRKIDTCPNPVPRDYDCVDTLAFVHGSFHWLCGISPNYSLVSLSISNEVHGEEIPLPETIRRVSSMRGYIKHGVSVFGGMLCCYSSRCTNWEVGTFKLWVMKDYGAKGTWNLAATIDCRNHFSPVPIYVYADGETLLCTRSKEGAGSLFVTSKGPFGFWHVCLLAQEGLVYTESLISPKLFTT